MFNRYPLFVKVSLGIFGGVLAIGDRDGAEVPTGRTRQMHVALGDHRYLRGRCRQSVRVRERVVHASGIGVLHKPKLYLAEPLTRPFIESTVCHNATRATG